MKTNLKPLNVICFGMGAIGTYIGGSLAAHGAKVVFIEKEETIKNLKDRAIHLRLGEKDISVHDFNITSSVSEALAYQPADIALLAVKSFDTPHVLESLSGYEINFPPVLCLQNGVENEAMLARRLGQDKVIAGTITTAVGRVSSGNIKLERLRGVGIQSGHPISLNLIDWFNVSGLRARGYSSKDNMKWSKLLTNLLANATSAILNWTPAQVYDHPLTWRLEVDQIRECLSVMKSMRAHLVNLPGTPVVPLVMAMKLLPYGLCQKLAGVPMSKGRGNKMPSLHIDLHSGKINSEVTYLNGAVSRFGEKYGIVTPVNQRLCELLEGIAGGAIQKSEFEDQPEKLDSWIRNEK